MYNKAIFKKAVIKTIKTVEGETIEKKLERMIHNNEKPGLKDRSPLIYTERSQGTQPQYDIRTDKMEVALDATTIAAKTALAKREDKLTKKAEALKALKGAKSDNNAEPTRGTGTGPNNGTGQES